MPTTSLSALDTAITHFAQSLPPGEDKKLAIQAMAFAEHIYAAMRAYRAEHGEISFIVVLKALRGLTKTVLREMDGNM